MRLTPLTKPSTGAPILASRSRVSSGESTVIRALRFHLRIEIGQVKRPSGAWAIAEAFNFQGTIPFPYYELQGIIEHGECQMGTHVCIVNLDAS